MGPGSVAGRSGPFVQDACGGTGKPGGAGEGAVLDHEPLRVVAAVGVVPAGRAGARRTA